MTKSICDVSIQPTLKKLGVKVDDVCNVVDFVIEPNITHLVFHNFNKRPAFGLRVDLPNKQITPVAVKLEGGDKYEFAALPEETKAALGIKDDALWVQWLAHLIFARIGGGVFSQFFA